MKNILTNLIWKLFQKRIECATFKAMQVINEEKSFKMLPVIKAFLLKRC